MKKKSSISLGPGAPSLILIFVVLSLSVLGMLSLMTARGDLRLSERGAEAVERVYRLREAAEERRAAVEAALRDGGEAALSALPAEDGPLAGVRLENGVLYWDETDGTRTLACALDITAGTSRWTMQQLSTNIGQDTAQQREAAAKLALADRMLARQTALDEMLVSCAQGAENWDAYMARVSAAMAAEPAAEGVTLENGRFYWTEADDTYRYACEVVIHPLDSERRSDFASTPVLLDEDGEEEVFAD